MSPSGISKITEEFNKYIDVVDAVSSKHAVFSRGFARSESAFLVWSGWLVVTSFHSTGVYRL